MAWPPLGVPGCLRSAARTPRLALLSRQITKPLARDVTDGFLKRGAT